MIRRNGRDLSPIMGNLGDKKGGGKEERKGNLDALSVQVEIM